MRPCYHQSQWNISNQLKSAHHYVSGPAPARHLSRCLGLSMWTAPVALNRTLQVTQLWQVLNTYLDNLCLSSAIMIIMKCLEFCFKTVKLNLFLWLTWDFQQLQEILELVVPWVLMKFFLISLHNVGVMPTRHMHACAYVCVLFKKKCI